jgi:lysyl-tRNA synthetase class 2
VRRPRTERFGRRTHDSAWLACVVWFLASLQNTRYRHRHLDMLVNRSILHPFHLRARVLASMRSFLVRHGFVEVETPILWTNHGGASAKPFRTSSHALGGESTPLFLRIAPELFLKELVIGGMERVFEVSKVFRNEGMDATHNPEFTTVEFYAAYKEYIELMDFTQTMLAEVVQAATGSNMVTLKNRFNGEQVNVDFTQPFKRIDVMDGLKSAIGAAELPDPNSVESLPYYLEVCRKHDLHLALPHTMPRVLDKLIGHFLEPQCVQPTFLLHHPECMSPLARRHPTRPGLTERFELFINGQEYANAYSGQATVRVRRACTSIVSLLLTCLYNRVSLFVVFPAELNDPADQYQRMQAQAQSARAGDEEAQPLDQHFCSQYVVGVCAHHRSSLLRRS